MNSQPHSATVEAAANVTGMVSLPTNSYDAIMHVISHVGKSCFCEYSLPTLSLVVTGAIPGFLT